MRTAIAIALSLLFVTSALANRKLLLFATVVGGGGGPGSSGFVLQTDGVSYILLVDGVSRLRKVH